MIIEPPFTFFFTDKDAFSNWYMRDFELQGIRFNCNEQCMMYGKARMFDDLVSAGKILSLPYPKDQKAAGKQVANFDQVMWDKRKLNLVYAGAKAKFTQHEDLYDLLLSTGNTELVEASPYDRIWGIGLAVSNPAARDKTQWRGQNLLGVVLKRLRDQLRLQDRPLFVSSSRRPGFK